MAGNYKVWQANPYGGFCCVTNLKNVERTFQIARGISRLQGFPQDAQFDMNPAYPKDVMLPDNFDNHEGFVVVSAKLKNYLEQKGVPGLEFLQVAIINHKGRVATPDCFIVNPLTVQDCIDLNASGVKWNAINPSAISSLQALVLDESKIDLQVTMFRPKGLLSAIVVHADLATDLTNQQFTGLRFVDCTEFRG